VRQILHLRVGRFFRAASLSHAEGLARTLDLTAQLDELAHRSCAAIEWTSATEAWCDLGQHRGANPWAVADRLHHEIKTTLALEVAFGVAGTRAAARAASALAAPSGLLVVLPGYEASIIDIARAQGKLERPVAETPLEPALLPRAIVRSGRLTAAGSADAGAHQDQAAALARSLAEDARAGMIVLGMLAGAVRVQFSGAGGIREMRASLPAHTALPHVIGDTAERLARRLAPAAAGQSAGRVSVALSQFVTGPAQGSLFGSRRLA
jgi:hypothetical protein